MTKDNPQIKLTLQNGGKSSGRPIWIFIGDITGIKKDTFVNARGYHPGRSVVFVNTDAKLWYVRESVDQIHEIIAKRLGGDPCGNISQLPKAA